MAFIQVKKRRGKRSKKEEIKLQYYNYNHKGKARSYRILTLPPHILEALNLKPKNYVNFHIDDNNDEIFFLSKSNKKSGHKITNRKYKQKIGNQYLFMGIPNREPSSKYVPHKIIDNGIIIYGNESI